MGDWVDLATHPLFHALAIKFGGSELVHLDLGDWLTFYAMVFAVGDFTGGNLILAEMDRSIPIPPRAAALFNARKMAHHVGHFEGTRLVLTGFIDKATAVHAGIAERKFWDLEGAPWENWARKRATGYLTLSKIKDKDKRHRRKKAMGL